VWRDRFEPLAVPALGDAPKLALPTDNRHAFALFAKRV
jgi:hypothetical protein